MVFIQLKWTCLLLKPDKFISSDPPWTLALILEIWSSCFQLLGDAQWLGKLKPREGKTSVWIALNFIPRLKVLHMWPSCKLSDHVFGEYLKIPNITKPAELLQNRNPLKTGGNMSFSSVCYKTSNTSQHHSLRYSFLDFIFNKIFGIKTYFKSLIPCYQQLLF